MTKILLGAGLKYLAGASIGFIVRALFVPQTRLTKTSFLLSEEEQGRIGAAIGGPIGLFMGLVIGASITDKTIQIEGKSEAEIKEILKDLRSKARVRDFR